MAGGYTVPTDGEFGTLFRRLEQVERRLGALEAPTGTQVMGRVEPRLVQDVQSGFSVSGSFSVCAAGAFTVPAGYSKALVTLSGLGGLRNDQASGWSALGLTAQIDAVASVVVSQSIQAGQFGSGSVGLTILLEGLVEGGSVSVECLMRFPSAHSLTVASVSATALFIR